MISAKFGEVKYSGPDYMLMADFTTIIHAMRDVLGPDDFMDAVKAAMLSEEELQEEIDRLKEENPEGMIAADMILQQLKSMWGDEA